VTTGSPVAPRRRANSSSRVSACSIRTLAPAPVSTPEPALPPERVRSAASASRTPATAPLPTACNASPPPVSAASLSNSPRRSAEVSRKPVCHPRASLRGLPEARDRARASLASGPSAAPNAETQIRRNCVVSKQKWQRSPPSMSTFEVPPAPAPAPGSSIRDPDEQRPGLDAHLRQRPDELRRRDRRHRAVTDPNDAVLQQGVVRVLATAAPTASGRRVATPLRRGSWPTR
jgi:hypothetical protein